MTRQPAHTYYAELDRRSVARAHRSIERRMQARPLPPCPSWCRYDGPHSHMDDEHWGPVKIATFVVFTFAFIWSLAFLGAAMGAAS